MGWTWDTGYRPAYEHEGYAAAVLDDGTDTAMHTDAIQDRVTGWRAACDCGWRGAGFWDRVEVFANDPAYRASVERYPTAASIAPPSVEGDETDAAVFAEWSGHLHATVPGLVVHDAVQAVTSATAALDRAVISARRRGASWSVIGGAVGVTRQHAHTRWAALETASTRETARSAP